MPEPNLVNASNEIMEDQMSLSDSLSLFLTEEKIKKILGKRIEDSRKWWNTEMDLDSTRENNEKRWLNKNFEVGGNSLYDYQVEYRDNRIFVSVETLASSLASKVPVPEITEAFDTDASRELAENFGMGLYRRAEDVFLKSKLQMIVRHLLMGYRFGAAKVFWDFNL